MTSARRLETCDGLPAGLAEIAIGDIRDIAPGPTLFRVAGARGAPLFISTLLHGNETTSFYVLQHLAREYATTPAPRPLLVFVGNPEAAAAGLRFTDGQADHNRIWAGGDAPEAALAAEATAIAREAGVFASIDIHNNTGANPLYGCINVLRAADLHLAGLFSRTAVYYRNPPTTQSMAFSAFCPAVTIECGQSGDEAGVTRAIAFVTDAMRMAAFPDRPPAPEDVSLYETVARVVVEEGVSMSFDGAPADLMFAGDLARRNFSETPAGAHWARFAGPRPPLAARNEEGRDLTERFFSFEDGVMRLARSTTPAMLTMDFDVIRKDCLCYLMEPRSLP